MRLELNVASGEELAAKRRSFSRLVWGVVALIGSQFLAPVLQFVQLVILAAVLSPSEFGQWALPIAIYGAAAIVFEVALPAAIVSQRGNARGLRVRWGCSVGAAFLCLGVIGSAVDLRGAGLLLGMVPAIGLMAWNVTARASLTLQHRFGTLAWTETLAAIVSVAVAISGAWAGWGITTLLVALLVRQSTLSLMQHRAAGPRLSSATEGVQGLALSWFYLTTYLGSNLDYLYAGHLLDATSAGLYFVAFNISTVVALKVATVANRVALPMISGGRNRDRRFERYYGLASACITAATAVMYAVVSVVDWSSLGTWSALEGAVSWLLIAGVGLAMSTVVSTILIADGARTLLGLLASTDIVISLIALTITGPTTAVDLGRLMAVLFVARGVVWSMICISRVRQDSARVRLGWWLAGWVASSVVLSWLGPQSSWPAVLVGLAASAFAFQALARLRAANQYEGAANGAQ